MRLPMSEVRYSAAGIGFHALDLTPPWEQPPPPVVFQHGLGLDASAWAPWMRRLARLRPVVSIDLRGHGSSREVGAGVDEPGIADYAADIMSVLEHLEIASCDFVGESFGGTVGLYLAAERPDVVRTLTVASTGWRGDLIQNVDSWAGTLSAPDGVAAWCETMTRASLDEGSVDPRLVDWVHRTQCATPPEVIIAIVRCLRGLDLTEALPRIQAPVLNLVARQSPFVAAEQHRILRDTLERCEQVDYWDARHRLFLTHADLCATDLQSFLARHRTTPAS